MSIRINKDKLLKIGYLAIEMIRKDMKEGKFQNDTNNHKYSEQYARYKKNDMRKFGRGKDRIGKGERLKNYKGISITSNETRFVNLILTGSMMRNITAYNLENGVRINFAGKDTGKIEGNRELGRDIVGLSDNNQKEIVKIFNLICGNEIDRQAGQNVKFDKIVIKVNI